MQMQGGYIMLKKILGVFKRDKTGFTVSELEDRKSVV